MHFALEFPDHRRILLLQVCRAGCRRHRREQPDSRDQAPKSSQGLNLWVHFLIGAGVVALVSEAIVIFKEGKQTQAIELGVLSVVLLAFRLLVNRLGPRTQRAVNLLTIFLLVVIGLTWFWFLDFILSVFNRG